MICDKTTVLRASVVALALVVGACSGADESAISPQDVAHDHDGHDHGVVDDSQHDANHDEPRDLETEPCGAGNWRELNPDLRQCALAGQDLDGESLRRADLTDADLAEATLVGADLFKGILVRANLKDAVVSGANLTSADLTGADLSGASLVGATLTNAKLNNALLNGATTNETTTCPDGTVGPCW